MPRTLYRNGTTTSTLFKQSSFLIKKEFQGHLSTTLCRAGRLNRNRFGRLANVAITVRTWRSVKKLLLVVFHSWSMMIALDDGTYLRFLAEMMLERVSRRRGWIDKRLDELVMITDLMWFRWVSIKGDADLVDTATKVLLTRKLDGQLATVDHGSWPEYYRNSRDKSEFSGTESRAIFWPFFDDEFYTSQSLNHRKKWRAGGTPQIFSVLTGGMMIHSLAFVPMIQISLHWF